MKASVIWQGGMEFQGSADSGHTITLDAAPDVGGQDHGSRPMELMALSLAGCTAMDVISILSKKRQQITSFEVQTLAQRSADHPKVFTALELRYIIRGKNIDPAAVERAVQLSEDKYCPAQAMLRQIAPIKLTIEIVEE